MPIVNFYEHGTYLTMHHGHTAMFGTYGMLSIALLLFSWRGMVDKAHWNNSILKVSFWGLNGGLFLMAFVTLLPVGAIQTWIAFRDGMWAARSAEFFELGPHCHPRQYQDNPRYDNHRLRSAAACLFSDQDLSAPETA